MVSLEELFDRYAKLNKSIHLYHWKEGFVVYVHFMYGVPDILYIVRSSNLTDLVSRLCGLLRLLELE